MPAIPRCPWFSGRVGEGNDGITPMAVKGMNGPGIFSHTWWLVNTLSIYFYQTLINLSISSFLTHVLILPPVPGPPGWVPLVSAGWCGSPAWLVAYIRENCH